MDKDQSERVQVEKQKTAVEIVFHRDCAPAALSASELEALGSVLPELVGELLQMELNSKSE